MYSQVVSSLGQPATIHVISPASLSQTNALQTISLPTLAQAKQEANRLGGNIEVVTITSNQTIKEDLDHSDS
jgi:hypothetical protein